MKDLVVLLSYCVFTFVFVFQICICISNLYLYLRHRCRCNIAIGEVLMTAMRAATIGWLAWIHWIQWIQDTWNRVAIVIIAIVIAISISMKSRKHKLLLCDWSDSSFDCYWAKNSWCNAAKDTCLAGGCPPLKLSVSMHRSIWPAPAWYWWMKALSGIFLFRQWDPLPFLSKWTKTNC